MNFIDEIKKRAKKDIKRIKSELVEFRTVKSKP